MTPIQQIRAAVEVFREKNPVVFSLISSQLEPLEHELFAAHRRNVQLAAEGLRLQAKIDALILERDALLGIKPRRARHVGNSGAEAHSG